MNSSVPTPGKTGTRTLPGSKSRSGQGSLEGPNVPSRRRRGRNKRRVATWWWVVPAVGLTLGIQFLSVGVGSIYAFTDWRGVGAFKFVGFDNFTKIFNSSEAMRALWNTLLIAVCFVTMTNVIGLAFAVRLNRLLKARYVMRMLIFMPVVLSPLAVAYIWRFIFQPHGPLNGFLSAIGLDNWATPWLGNPDTAIWTIIVVVVWQNIGLAMVIYLAGLANIPPELEEAAAVDGASATRRFVHIVLPLLRPMIVLSSTLAVIQGLRVFDQVQAMTGGGPFNATQTLSTLVYRETFVRGQFGYGAALSVLLTILITAAAVLQVILLRQEND